ncbi:MAG TPA: hypothetical protein DCG53_07520 [Syntrophus sp. (in: bacteria)]|jgi:hypothetical protein|nr:hypothetical protein [Syntrophus sp. (in: bacteria)]
MNRRNQAIHESGHAVMAHYSGVKIEQVSMQEVKFSGPLENQEGKGVLLKYIFINLAGFMSQFLHYGEAEFWRLNPRELIPGCLDITRIVDQDLPTITTKEQIQVVLISLQGFLSQPGIWGKVETLADEIMDHPEGLKDVESILIRCQRERVPEHDAGPLIDFLCDHLYRKEA